MSTVSKRLFSLVIVHNLQVLRMASSPTQTFRVSKLLKLTLKRACRVLLHIPTVLYLIPITTNTLCCSVRTFLKM